MNDSRRSRRPDSRQMWDDSDRRDRNPPRDRERERGWDNRDRERDRGRGGDRRGYRSRSRERRDNQRDRSMSPDKHRRDRGETEIEAAETVAQDGMEIGGIALVGRTIGMIAMTNDRSIATTVAAHHPLPTPPCPPAPIQKTAPANPSPTSKSNPTSAAPHPLAATAAAEETHHPRQSEWSRTNTTTTSRSKAKTTTTWPPCKP
ncbi:hypothetical protein TsFJ059_001656 [Trichoderma semiorbis]|uniref:Uncharacterized protein n=1 Tax=Trichoderma semiorbis TaxID=1491008 RepID=A0A9P8HY12_9HYPO|nr:hypothetical protein TsFJ059_001656 [Trichoderma semiorbis]